MGWFGPVAGEVNEHGRAGLGTDCLGWGWGASQQRGLPATPWLTSAARAGDTEAMGFYMTFQRGGADWGNAHSWERAQFR